MLSMLCGVKATKPCRRTPTSSSLLSEPSTVKLFERARWPLTENWPAVPMPAPMPRRAGFQRAQLLVSSSQRRALHAALDAVLPILRASAEGKRLRWSTDVDPIDLY